ncbi:pheophorbide a oxygenase [Seminavis robusta]|nr:pheophorbide a oxygenase [Seminavis robusta]|eukprot:Sro2925_g340390.1 pheophorbide a oxygenase (119) ;mRNA; r:9959-10315
MPAECDRSIVALHGWIGNYASSYVKRQSTKLPPAIYDRSILFDHFDQHTSKCKICSTALDKLQRRKRNSQIVLAASILLGLRFWPMRLLAVASLGTWRFWSQIEGKFYKGEFKHHQNH